MKKRAIYYDTETTGIRPSEDAIIEIAAFCPDTNESFVSFINPGRPIPKEASAISHITDDMVADADDFKIVGQKFIDFCGEGCVLIAHNNDAFDQPFLKHSFASSDIPFPPFEFLDSLKWARKYRPDLPRHSLQYLREIYHIEANQAHRALDDVMVLYKVFSKMIDNLSLEAVMTLLKRSPSTKPLYMPFGKHKGTPLKKVPKSYLTWLEGSGALDKTENEGLKQSLLEMKLI